MDKAVTVLIIIVILGAVEILDSILLFIGALKEIRVLCIIWVVGKFVELFLSFAALFAPMSISKGVDRPFAPYVSVKIFGNLYFLWVVRGHDLYEGT